MHISRRPGAKLPILISVRIANLIPCTRLSAGGLRVRAFLILFALFGLLAGVLLLYFYIGGGSTQGADTGPPLLLLLDARRGSAERGQGSVAGLGRRQRGV